MDGCKLMWVYVDGLGWMWVEMDGCGWISTNGYVGSSPVY